MAKRNEVKINLPNESLQVSAAPVDTFAPMEQQKLKKSKLASAMGALQDSLPAFGQLAADLQKDIEADATLQENRKLLGKGPSNDATKKGIKAQKFVTVRNKASQAIGELKSRLNSGVYSDEEYEALIAEAQDKVTKWTGDDKDLIKAASGYFREALPQLYELRGQKTEMKRQEELYFLNQESLVLATKGDFTPEEVRKNVAKVLEEMGMQGLSRETMQKTLMDTAAEQAERKDLTLMDWVKEQKPEWYRNSSKMQQADKTAHELLFTDSQGEVAQTKSDIEAKYTNNLQLTEEEWYKEAGKLSLYDKPLYTETQMRSFWNQLQNKRVGDGITDMMFQQMLVNTSDKEADPIPVLSGKPLTQKQSVALVTKFDKYQERQTADWQAANPEATEEEAVEFAAKQHRDKASAILNSGITDPAWKESMSILDARDFNQLVPGKDKLPTGVKNTLSLMDDLKDNPAALAAHATDTAISLAENFRSNMLSGMDEVSAYQAAYKMAHTKVNLSADERKKINKAGVSVVEDQYEQWFDGVEDIPTAQRDVMGKAISRRMTNLYSVGIPLEKAQKMAAKEYQQTHFQLPNGKVVTGNLAVLANIGEVSQHRALEVLDNLPSRIVNDFEEGDSFVIDPYTPVEEWYPVITPDGGIYFTDVSGTMRMTKTMTINQAMGKSNAAKAKEIQEEKARVLEFQRKQAEESVGWPTHFTPPLKNPYSMWDK